MLNYDPTTKLYHVKRVYVPDHILERNASIKERERGGKEEEEEGKERASDDGGDVDSGADRVSDEEESAVKSEETAKVAGVEKKEV